ncbi:MAG: hypothetical protein WKF31_06695 [Thermoleophilaceae bacterium]
MFLSPADTRGLRRVPWYVALRTVGLAFGASEETLDLELAAATDPTGLSPRELPLAPDVGPPGVPGRRPEPVVGLRDLAHVARFGLDAVRSIDRNGELSRSIPLPRRRFIGWPDRRPPSPLDLHNSPHVARLRG